MKLAGRTALVTGAGRGIGKGCALELARAGADIVANDRADSSDLENTADEIRGLGRTCEAIPSDVFERSSCESLVAQAIERCGRIDILVSNPARGRRNAFLDFPPDDFEDTIRCTLIAGFHISQLVARHMVENGNGKIIFISSVQAEMPFAMSSAYNAAKAGLNHFALTVAAELAPHRIHVNVIEPGWIKTPGEVATFGEDHIRQHEQSLPWRRLGQPEDIGKAA
ncbi:MAG: SDR family oxidoreductase, partial [Pirellulaceae bacterium]|nr:SDR family oxidoreductase [Pirellulaceae bacterium]